MIKFKKKSLCLALAVSLGSVTLASNAIAQTPPPNGMYVNSDGLGQVLLFPYYTTRGGMDTYLSVVNTTGQTKAVKVRFLESRNSREVLDFNLYLSPYDMWTAAVVNDSAGAKIVTRDKSCTTPEIPEAGEPFVNFAYTGEITPEMELADGINIGGADGATGSVDRTREGYFEIIEMGVVGEDIGDGYDADLVAGIKHSNGVPKDCSGLQDLIDLEDGEGEDMLGMGRPTGGLTGSAALVAAAFGTEFSFDPVAIDNFANHEIWHEAGTIEPDLRHGIHESLVFYDHEVVYSNWAGSGAYEDPVDGSSHDSVNAVNALLMHNQVINEFVLDADTDSASDWVVTMPTKRYSVPIWDGEGDDPPDYYAPFTTTFGANGACEPVKIDFWDREERKKTVAAFSPPRPGSTTKLCWEANVITFNNSDVLSSAHSENIDVGSFQAGWMRLDFASTAHKLESNDAETISYYGLPVIGMMVADFVNMNAAPSVMATYAGNFNHKYGTSIAGGGTPPDPTCAQQGGYFYNNICYDFPGCDAIGTPDELNHVCIPDVPNGGPSPENCAKVNAVFLPANAANNGTSPAMCVSNGECNGTGNLDGNVDGNNTCVNIGNPAHNPKPA